MVISKDRSEYVGVYVTKELSKKMKELDSDEERKKVFEEYFETIEKKSKDEYRANLENLEEDVAIYTGLMLKVKQAFEKAKNEQLKSSYELWEKFDEDIPSIKEKTTNIISKLNPVIEKLKETNDLLNSISTYSFEKLINVIKEVANLYGKDKEMVKFLIDNFKNK